MSKHGFDKFYTKSDIVDMCLDTINLTNYNLIIEPSAGNGAFYNKIYHKNKIGIDILPEMDDIISHDFLTWDIPQFPYPEKILVLGNPPFGRNGSLALKFIKKAILWNADIAFILPKGFKKRSMYDKISLNYEKIMEMDLPINSFTFNNVDYDVPCVWQIYTPSTKTREKEKKLIPQFFKFTTKQNANFTIRRVGVNAGNIYDRIDRSESSHYFLYSNHKNILLRNINKTLFSDNDTTGPRSIPKNELIIILDSVVKKNINIPQ